jgi:hypothetical protein
MGNCVTCCRIPSSGCAGTGCVRSIRSSNSCCCLQLPARRIAHANADADVPCTDDGALTPVHQEPVDVAMRIPYAVMSAAHDVGSAIVSTGSIIMTTTAGTATAATAAAADAASTAVDAASTAVHAASTAIACTVTYISDTVARVAATAAASPIEGVKRALLSSVRPLVMRTLIVIPLATGTLYAVKFCVVHVAQQSPSTVWLGLMVDRVIPTVALGIGCALLFAIRTSV